jgi:cytochrome c oxidase assembly protein subunit 11
MAAAQSHKKLVTKLLVWAVGMFGFALFVMPPLYDLFCEITGVGIREAERYEATPVAVDTSREVSVIFAATNNEEMPWRFEPMQSKVVVHPGERYEVKFYAKNLTDRDMIGQAIPGLVPFSAGDFFHKTECFCFNNQPLAAGEEAELALVFVIDPELPRSINSLVMSYTLFDITPATADTVAQLQ